MCFGGPSAVGARACSGLDHGSGVLGVLRLLHHHHSNGRSPRLRPPGRRSRLRWPFCIRHSNLQGQVPRSTTLAPLHPRTLQPLASGHLLTCKPRWRGSVICAISACQSLFPQHPSRPIFVHLCPSVSIRGSFSTRPCPYICVHLWFYPRPSRSIRGSTRPVHLCPSVSIRGSFSTRPCPYIGVHPWFYPRPSRSIRGSFSTRPAASICGSTTAHPHPSLIHLAYAAQG